MIKLLRDIKTAVVFTVDFNAKGEGSGTQPGTIIKETQYDCYDFEDADGKRYAEYWVSD